MTVNVCKMAQRGTAGLIFTLGAALSPAQADSSACADSVYVDGGGLQCADENASLWVSCNDGTYVESLDGPFDAISEGVLDALCKYECRDTAEQGKVCSGSFAVVDGLIAMEDSAAVLDN
jgi:hypothetical protein